MSAESGVPTYRQSGARRIELNVDDTELSHLFDERWRGAAGQLLPERFPLSTGGGDGAARP